MYQSKPYFMKNSEWYYYDPNDGERGYKLTPQAPPEAIKSYNEFYAKCSYRENGVEWVCD